MNNTYYKYKFIHLPVVLLYLLGTACTSEQEVIEDKEELKQEVLVQFSQEQVDVGGLIIGSASKRNIGTELQVNGIIDVPPHSKVSINLPYGGFLKDTRMLPGTEVKKGQLIAVIENPDFIEFQQEYLESVAKQEYLKAEYERQVKLYKEEVSSEKTYQQAKSDFLANDVLVRTMGARLELIGFNLNTVKQGNTSASVNIYSPISGFVREVYTNVGKHIDPEDPIMDITDTKDLHVELSVFEHDIPHIKVGQTILFTVTNSPNLVREAEVFLIGSSVREDRSVTVHGHLKNSEKDLLPGMYVSANLIIDTRESWTVANEAVVRFNGKNYVYVLVNHSENIKAVYSFEIKEVIVGTTENNYTQVEYTSNKDDIGKDKIVLAGAYTILAESKNSNEQGH